MEEKIIYIGSKLRYSEEEKRCVVEYFLSHKYTKQYVWQKFTGQSSEHGQILRWLRELGYDNSQPRSFVYFDPVERSKNKSESSTAEELEALKRELEETKLKAKAFEMMIELAEQEFKIKIKKKYGTKPSKK
jgi:DNA primase catalytic subunit